MNQKKKMRYTSQKGITLIALVITIIVLLILAGVTISMVLGDDGIIKQAQNAKGAYENAAQNEQNIISGFEQYLDLNDSRLNNEEIKITEPEQLYALGRLLVSDSKRTTYLPSYETDGSLQDDLAEFEYPSDITTDTQKVEYLMTTSYRLENDIELKLLKTAYANNYAIGSDDRPFKGFFNGNNKTITIKNNDSTSRETFNGVFGDIENAVITNLNVELGDDINMTLGIGGEFLGILVKTMKDSKLYNNNVNLDGKSMQIIFDSASYKQTLKIGGIAGWINENSEVKKCSFNLKNNASIFISNTNDSDSYDYHFGCIAARTSGTETERVNISDCSVNLENSNISMIAPKLGFLRRNCCLCRKNNIYWYKS